LQLGGTTSSFSAIKANGTSLNFRLADDSADCGITCGTLTTSGTAIFNKQAYFAQTTLTYGASYSWDVSSNQSAIITLTGNITITPTNMAAGATYVIIIKQDGTGSRTATWVNCKWPGSTAPVLSTAASAIDILTFVSDGTYLYGVAQKAFG
jgi:hypothetical protein